MMLTNTPLPWGKRLPLAKPATPTPYNGREIASLYVLNDSCSPAPTVLPGKGPISVAHRVNYISQISLLLGVSQKLYVFKKPLQLPLFQWESLEQVVCVLAYMSRELHTSLGLVGRRLPFFSSSESRGEGGGVAFCPSIFFWGESSVTGVMGASRGAEPGGVSGIPMKEATGVLGNVPGVT